MAFKFRRFRNYLFVVSVAVNKLKKKLNIFFCSFLEVKMEFFTSSEKLRAAFLS